MQEAASHTNRTRAAGAAEDALNVVRNTLIENRQAIPC
jgi:hypothetical protein